MRVLNLVSSYCNTYSDGVAFVGSIGYYNFWVGGFDFCWYIRFFDEFNGVGALGYRDVMRWEALRKANPFFAGTFFPEGSL